VEGIFFFCSPPADYALKQKDTSISKLYFGISIGLEVNRVQKCVDITILRYEPLLVRYARTLANPDGTAMLINKRRFSSTL
jgi:hypothetical protein